MTSQYSSLARAQLSYEYLHTNSTTHEFLFGAIVELVDNSRDASASTMKIYSEENENYRGGAVLCFLDDGAGMDRTEAANVMTFGYSGKRLESFMIGQYGNGLKSGAMRMGKDFILFTKKSGVATIVFLSRTFHEKERIEEVLVPMPAFTADNKEPLVRDEDEKVKHELEIELICNYSPYKSKEELLSQFDMIEGDHGTLVVVYNLRLLDNGEPELDWKTDKMDIRVADPDRRDVSLVPERSSLRAYLSIVYSDPRMKIYIQGQKVRTRRVVGALYKAKQYKFTSQRFKARAEKEAAKAKEYARTANEKQVESESKLKDFENKHGSTPIDRVLRAEWRQLRDAATVAKQTAKDAADRAKEKEKSKNDPKVLTFIFGMNIERRSHDGCMVYNNGRLIKMYQQVGPQLEGGVKCAGVIGVVDVPYVVLEPTHNKQDFADAREYRALLKALGEYIEQYWKDMNLASKPGGVLQFWRHYGYESNDWQAPPSDDKMFVTRREMSVQVTLQCDACLKWRVVPFNVNYVGKDYPEGWICKDNTDTTLNSCSIAEKKHTFPEGKIDRSLTAEAAEKKKEQLQKKIEKQKSELEKLTEVTGPSPSESRRSAAQKASQRMSGSRQKSPSPSPPPPPPPSRGSKRSVEKPKTKAELRAQLEKEKQAKLKEKIEAERKKKMEEEKKRKAKLEEQRKRDAARQKAAAESKKKHQVAQRGRKQPEEEEEEDESDEEEEEEEPPARAARGSQRASNSPQKAVKTAPQRGTPKEDAASSAGRRRKSPTPPKETPPPKKSRPGRSSVEQGEAHSSSTDTEVTSSTAPSGEKTEMLAKQLRRVLAFFLPPDWKLNKEQIYKQNVDQLIGMDLGQFFQYYEKGLKQLVLTHQKAAEDSKQSLSRVRRLTATLLRSISQDFDIDSSCDTEQVDLLLEECLRQFQNGTLNTSDG